MVQPSSHGCGYICIYQIFFNINSAFMEGNWVTEEQGGGRLCIFFSHTHTHIPHALSLCHLKCSSPSFLQSQSFNPWRRKWQPTLVFLPGKSHGQRSLAVYSPWGHQELDTTERLNHQSFDSWSQKSFFPQPFTSSAVPSCLWTLREFPVSLAKVGT